MNEEFLLEQIEIENKIETENQGLLVCDFCFRSEIDDLINDRGKEPMIIVKTNDGLLICEECLSHVDLAL